MLSSSTQDRVINLSGQQSLQPTKNQSKQNQGELGDEHSERKSELTEQAYEQNPEHLTEQPSDHKSEQKFAEYKSEQLPIEEFIAPESYCGKAKRYFYSVVGSTIGGGSGLGATIYSLGAREAAATKISADWLFSLSPAWIFEKCYVGFSTFVISGVYGSRYVQIAMSRIQEEVLLFRQRINTKRFIAETTMAFLAGITGGAISGGAYSGDWQWFGRCTGFGMVFSLSFLGLSELIIKLTDKNYAFQLTIIDHLKRLSPRYHRQVNKLLQDNELNRETLLEFLTKVFLLAKTVEEENLFRTEKIKDSFFQEITPAEYKKEKIGSVVDFGVRSLFTSICSFMYFQGGFLGTNVILDNLLDDIANIAKICIGASVGFPLAFFIFFNIPIFKSPVVELYPEIKNDLWAMLKMLILIVLNAGNATWYEGLAEQTAYNENIFLGALDSTFGHDIFPVIAYLTCFILGMNGLAPTLFPPHINTKHPQLDDVIKYLKLNFSPTVMQELKKLSLFKHDEQKPEAIELKNTARSNHPRIMSPLAV